MININLLPPELKLKRLGAKHTASLVSVCIIIVLVAGVLGVIAKSAKATVEARLGNAQTDIGQSQNPQGEIKQLEEMAIFINDRAQTTAEINKTRAIWSQVLQELSNDSPSDVQFQTVTANAEKSPNFILAGATSSDREIIKFKEKLQSSGFFKNVAFKNSSLNSASTTPGQQVTFTLEFDLAKFASSATAGATK